MGTLTLDDSGGTALQGATGNEQQGRYLVLAEPDLRALDLHDDPHLEVLDLSACGEQDVLHLQLDRVPNLREIRLPVLRGGAVIHRFTLALPRTLSVHGRVSEFDADWQAGSLRLCAEGAPWTALRVLGKGARLHDLALQHDFVAQERLASRGIAPIGGPLTIVLCRDTLPERLHLTEEGQWWLADASQVASLVIDGPSRVHARKAGALETLTQLRAGRCEIEGAHGLAKVQGPAGQMRHHASQPPPQDVRHHMRKPLTLRGEMPSLTVADGWSDVQLHAPALTHLQLGWAKHLALYHCGRLDQVALPDGLPVDCHGEVPTPLLNQARFFIDEASLKQSLRRLEAGELSLLEGVLNVLSQRYTPQAAFHSLSTLCHLAEQGIALSELWQCRRTLIAWQRQQGRKRKHPVLRDADYLRADKHWGWELPVDRLEEGLNADLHLWALCLPASKDAQAFRKTLLKEGQTPSQLGYLLRAATREKAPEALVTLILDVLTALYRQQPWPCMHVPSKQSGATRYLPRLLKAAQSDAQRQAVMHAMVEMMPWKDVPQQLGALRAAYPGEARALIMTLSRQPDEWWRWKLSRHLFSREKMAQLRQALTRQALMPANTDMTALNAIVAPEGASDDMDDILNIPLTTIRYRPSRRRRTSP
ncbi:hypothetical protein GLV89_09145 [Halomonas alkaliantarctica]|nr:hypothetical protein [Halomonas alkaliantarctica]